MGVTRERDYYHRHIAFYSTFHAALTDKFGVNWNIVAEKTPDNH